MHRYATGLHALIFFSFLSVQFNAQKRPLAGQLRESFLIGEFLEERIIQVIVNLHRKRNSAIWEIFNLSHSQLRIDYVH
jgi:hypothetical protein